MDGVGWLVGWFVEVVRASGGQVEPSEATGCWVASRRILAGVFISMGLTAGSGWGGVMGWMCDELRIRISRAPGLDRIRSWLLSGLGCGFWGLGLRGRGGRRGGGVLPAE